MVVILYVVKLSSTPSGHDRNVKYKTWALLYNST